MNLMFVAAAAGVLALLFALVLTGKVNKVINFDRKKAGTKPSSFGEKMS